MTHNWTKKIITKIKMTTNLKKLYRKYIINKYVYVEKIS